MQTVAPRSSASGWPPRNRAGAIPAPC